MIKTLTPEQQEFYDTFLVLPENVHHQIAIDNAFEDLREACTRLGCLGMGLHIVKCRVEDHLKELKKEFGFRNDPAFDVNDDGTYEVDDEDA